MGFAAPTPQIIRFADFTLDLQTAELSHNDSKVTLQEQPFQILTALLETPGKLVTRDDLIKRLWPSGTFVDFDQSLNKAVARLREALGESGDERKFIETLPRRGYRFVGTIERHERATPEVSRRLEIVRPDEQKESKTASPRGTRNRMLWLGAALAVGAIIFLILKATISTPNTATALAVMPFQNSTANKEIDFLRFALQDEVATALSYATSISIRPFAITNRHDNPDLDLQKVARAMRVSKVVTGHYLLEGDRLQVVLEMADVESNRVRWRSTVTSSQSDQIGLRRQITQTIRSGLLPALGISATSDAMTQPHNEQAYNAYLRSIPLSHEPGTNPAAIALLESSVALDPSFAPAWEALGRRYNNAAQFANGGKSMVDLSEAALQRALALDPNRIVAAAELITHQAERRELSKAFEGARKLAANHPESANAHYVLGYVYRYAGMLDSSATECDTALGLDPGNYDFRTCAWTFTELGKTERARDFIALDPSSEWAAYGMVTVLMEEGKRAEALTEAGKITHNPNHLRDLLESCLQDNAADLGRFAREAEATLNLPIDPEVLYYQGAILVYCGAPDSGVRLLAGAIHGNYCAKTAVQTDPLLANLRGTEQHNELLLAAKDCERKLLESSRVAQIRTDGPLVSRFSRRGGGAPPAFDLP